jgi:hypothetical protein
LHISLDTINLVLLTRFPVSIGPTLSYITLRFFDIHSFTWIPIVEAGRVSITGRRIIKNTSYQHFQPFDLLDVSVSTPPFIPRHEPLDCGFATLGKPSFDYPSGLESRPFPLPFNLMFFHTSNSSTPPTLCQQSLLFPTAIISLHRTMTNKPEMPAPQPQITTPPSTITLIDLVGRQQITTISVVASSTPSGVSSGDDTSEKKPFPVAVAIPALVGGMAAAFGAFGLWWWCSKRNKKQRRVSLVLTSTLLHLLLPRESTLFLRSQRISRMKLIDRNDGKQRRERNNAKEQIQLDDPQSPVPVDHPLQTSRTLLKRM